MSYGEGGGLPVGSIAVVILCGVALVPIAALFVALTRTLLS